VAGADFEGESVDAGRSRMQRSRSKASRDPWSTWIA